MRADASLASGHPLSRIRYQTIEFGDLDIHVRTLRDTQQFRDDDGVAAALGICSAAWPLFGVVWDSGRVLAQLMLGTELAGRRILEVGCGIGLASLILNHRRADITATDHHPEAAEFLARNVALNGGAPIPFVRAAWAGDDCGLGEFDLIIGSDVLYEREQAELLSVFIDRHARPTCEVIIVDPGRQQMASFSKRMVNLGYAHSQAQFDPQPGVEQSVRGRVLRYTR